MKSLHLHSFSAKNFFCFGEKPVHFQCDKLGRLSVISGINHDSKNISSVSNLASNGSGKSSIPDIITYGLFGRVSKGNKKISHEKIINRKSRKNLVVEVVINDLKVVRRRKPDALQVWKSKEHLWDDASELTCGTSSSTQKLIEDELGISYSTFCTLVVFDDAANNCFLEADQPTKRAMVDRMSGLEQFRSCADLVKFELKQAKQKHEIKLEAYNHLSAQQDQLSSTKKSVLERHEKWHLDQASELERFRREKEDAIQSLENETIELTICARKIDHRRDHITEKIKNIEEVIDTLSDKRNVAETEVEKAQKICFSQRSHVSQLHRDKEQAEARISGFSSLSKTMTCDRCHQPVDNVHFNRQLDLYNKQSKSCETRISEQKTYLEGLEKQLDSAKLHLTKISKLCQKGFDSKNKLKLQETQLRIEFENNLRRKTEVEEHKNFLKNKLAEENKISEKNNPFDKILQELEQNLEKVKDDIDNCQIQIAQIEDILPYFEFWKQAFGDQGIRKYIIRTGLDALNSRLHFWLEILYHGTLAVEFDEQLKEKIYRNHQECDYQNLSKGEKQRVNLAVSLAFAHMMAVTTGISPSFIFLDEVTGGGIDEAGIQDIFNMIRNIAEEKQTFVTTHNEQLSELLSAYPAITLEKKNDVTVRIS